MEQYNYNEKENKIGGGIITISILVMLGALYNVFSSIKSILNPNTEKSFESLYKSSGIEFHARPTSYFIIILILSIITVISIILILNKKSLGVYGYFTCFIINIIATFIFRTFSLKTTLMYIPFSFILPILMLIFVNKKKKLFNF